MTISFLGRVNALLHYDPISGKFYRKTRAGNKRIGDETGSKDPEGYIRIGLDGKTYKAQRLAWLITYGRWPMPGVDHKNGIRDDNRISNLREAGKAENGWNATKRVDNTSGVKGVSFNKIHNRWQARVTVRGKVINLGWYRDLSEAEAARQILAEIHHGEFFNAGSL